MSKIDRKTKAIKLFKDNKIIEELKTDKRRHFIVKGYTENHTIIFNKIKNLWDCDCKFSSLKNKECSHIMACKMKI